MVNPVGMPSGPIGMAAFLAGCLLIALATHKDLSAFWWSVALIPIGVLVMSTAVLLLTMIDKFLKSHERVHAVYQAMFWMILAVLVAGFLTCAIGVLAAGWNLGEAVAPYLVGGF
jgi:hypothetical protein